MSSPLSESSISTATNLSKLKKHQNIVDHQDYPPADFGPRFLAQLLDGIFSQSLTALAVALLYRDRSSETPKLSILLISFEVGLLYIAIPMYAWGQNFGKRVMKLKVVHSETGEHLSFWQILNREYFARFIVGITLGFGYMGILRRPDRRGLHDFIAHTRVVSLKKD